MPPIPSFDAKTSTCKSPHVVLLGAGASKAAFPHGDKNGKIVPVMQEIIDVVDLSPLLQTYDINCTSANFEEFYSDLATSGKNEELLTGLEDAIRNYFAALELPDEPTIYDYLVLSLRSKDVIATFNWDPFLAQAFLRNKEIAAPEMPEILFLHGNVKIGLCREHRNKGFLNYNFCPSCNKVLSEPSKLLYPVKDKNYESDEFIKSEWNNLRYYLGNAYVATVFGYSAPITDVAAVDLMLKAWDDNPIKEFTHLGIIDIKNEDKLKITWEKFKAWSFSGATKNIEDTWLFGFPRRDCDALCMANFQQAPWSTNKYPKFKTLEELHDWIKPLIDEEKKQSKLSANGKG